MTFPQLLSINIKLVVMDGLHEPKARIRKTESRLVLLSQKSCDPQPMSPPLSHALSAYFFYLEMFFKRLFLL